ncbi:MAG: XRE family transcriptional regulator [Parvularcula sp.]|jgi:predicted XRE-type DNA-binding protein|nr:XRE family transcriptional regulator [Parvularcula sp.]
MVATETFSNVWNALTESPAEAAAMTLRADLAIDVEEALRAWNLPPAGVAERLGVPVETAVSLLDGEIDALDIDALVALALRAGLNVRIETAAA